MNQLICNTPAGTPAQSELIRAAVGEPKSPIRHPQLTLRPPRPISQVRTSKAESGRSPTWQSVRRLPAEHLPPEPPQKYALAIWGVAVVMLVVGVELEILVRRQQRESAPIAREY